MRDLLGAIILDSIEKIGDVPPLERNATSTRSPRNSAVLQ